MTPQEISECKKTLDECIKEMDGIKPLISQHGDALLQQQYDELIRKIGEVRASLRSETIDDILE